MAEARAFFAGAPAAKRALSRSRDNPWGYYDRELTKNLRDRKDIFDFGPDDSDPADPFGRTTLWPDGATTFSATMRELMAQFKTLADRLVRIVMTGLGEPESVVAEAFGPSPTSSCG